MGGESPVVLEVLFQAVRLGVVTARSHRSDLGRLRDGNVGFSFDLAPAIPERSFPLVAQGLKVRVIGGAANGQDLPVYEPLARRIANERGVDATVVQAQLARHGEVIQYALDTQPGVRCVPVCARLNGQPISERHLFRATGSSNFVLSFNEKALAAVLDDAASSGVLSVTALGHEVSHDLPVHGLPVKPLPRLKGLAYSHKASTFVGNHGNRSDGEIDELLKHVQNVMSGLSNHGQVFLNGGALIGAHRNGRLMEFDDDVDIALYVGECASTLEASVRFRDSLQAFAEEQQARVEFLGNGQAHIFTASHHLPVDCFICWSMGGRLFLHWGVAGQLDKCHAELHEQVALHGRSFRTFYRSRDLLAALYGADWLYPNPDFFFKQTPSALRRWRLLWNWGDAAETPSRLAQVGCAGDADSRVLHDLRFGGAHRDLFPALQAITDAPRTQACVELTEDYLALGQKARSLLHDLLDHMASAHPVTLKVHGWSDAAHSLLMQQYDSASDPVIPHGGGPEATGTYTLMCRV
jgi:hypothetical protein